jgi:hypothetical protein
MKHSRLPSRQIHLDFHTSPYIPDVGKDFNAGAFAETMAKAGRSASDFKDLSFLSRFHFPIIH